MIGSWTLEHLKYSGLSSNKVVQSSCIKVLRSFFFAASLESVRMWSLGFELKEFNIPVADVFFVLFLRAFEVFLGVEGDLARAIWSIWAHFKVTVQNSDRREKLKIGFS